MAQLTVRNVDEKIVAALKARATQAGRSAEAEHRRILTEALQRDVASDFFETARARRIRLPPGSPSTSDILREDRDRKGS